MKDFCLRTLTSDTALPNVQELLDSKPATTKSDREAKLQQTIHRAAELLPSQGPITSFVFLNTLQALEHMPFHDGMKKGARLFSCQPYLPEDAYRQKLSSGRIRKQDLKAVLLEDLNSHAEDLVCGLVSRQGLRMAMLEYPMHSGPAAELKWFVEETDALSKVRADAPAGTAQRLIEQTRHWVMRDLRDTTDPQSDRSKSRLAHRIFLDMAKLLEHFGVSTIEQWTDATWEAFSLQALWRVCCDGARAAPHYPARHDVIRHRDVLLHTCGEDSDALVNGLLIRFCAAFVDQGFADWQLPERDQGFYRSFIALYRHARNTPDYWRRDLPDELARLAEGGMSPLDSIIESFAMLGVREEEWDEYIATTLLSLRGWAGMIWQNEVRGDRVAIPVLPGTLVEFVAVRLILERLALAYVAKTTLNFQGSLKDIRSLQHSPKADAHAGIDQRAFVLFQLSQVLGWTPAALHGLSKEKWKELIAEIERFHNVERRRLFHMAFERRLCNRALDAIAIHAASRPPQRIANPRFQVITCIDTREESFHRHLEEIAPDSEGFSAAGFYGVPIYYRGVADAHFVPLCPIVVRAQHWVTEDVVYSFERTHRRRESARRALGAASLQVHMRSRSIAGGALLTAGLGVLASIPLVARVLFPRLTARLRKTAGRFVAPPSITRLRLERTAAKAGSGDDQIGFTLEEMTFFVERTLRDIGLTSGFGKIVIFLGHGSFCLNNPHKSAYDCGACSGNAGGPNARTFAAMCNNPHVRSELAKRGIEIPSDTWVVGGLHNTCSDSITYYDLDLLPRARMQDFLAAEETLEQVCERNSHERCRRFESAPLNMSFAAAHRHVERRTEDLAETRPEYGNASNAICVVGRRARTRNLYLDRRSFLMSYDPTQDDAQHTILGRILGAVVPVCEGINMQYTLSAIDSPGWGCGTKLPHNITSLLGVMDGAASDLRPGLPWQGVEIHEPVRLLFVIETTPEGLLQIMGRNETVGKILRNGWSRVALMDPVTAKLSIYRDGEFHPYEPESTELPKAPSSLDWYRGWRDNLDFAQIEPTKDSQVVPVLRRSMWVQ